MMYKTHMQEYRKKPFWFLRIIGWVILGLIGAAILSFILGYVVMLLWNWIMPGIFGVIQITFWQSFGIILLARIIFGSFKHHHERRSFSSSKRWKPSFFKSSKTEHYKKWKYFDSFWEDEGENAFNQYVDKTQKSNENMEDHEK